MLRLLHRRACGGARRTVVFDRCGLCGWHVQVPVLSVRTHVSACACIGLSVRIHMRICHCVYLILQTGHIFRRIYIHTTQIRPSHERARHQVLGATQEAAASGPAQWRSVCVVYTDTYTYTYIHVYMYMYTQIHIHTYM